MSQEPKSNPKEKESDRNSLFSIGYDLFILGLTIFSLIVTTGILWPGTPSSDFILYWSDFLICFIFFIDFLLMLRRTPNKTDYFLNQGGWLDILGAIPVVPGHAWTAVFRLGRLNRMMRIIKHLRGKSYKETDSNAHWGSANTVLLSTLLIGIILVTVSSMLVLRAEQYAPNAYIIDGKTAFWWAIVTITTVGYGDFVPVTNIGRTLAIGLMIFGIGVFAVFTSFMASKFVAAQNDMTELISEIQEENATIRSDLAEIKQLIQQKKEVEEA